jgi:hypothetical protein
MMNAYDEIFAGVKSVKDLEHAIARAVRHLREAMEKEDNRAVTAAHMRNLRELDSGALAMAYAAAEKTCTFWPTPGQIRELAGASEDSAARTALQWVFGYLSKHGVEGRASGGAVCYGEDATGRHVELSVTPTVAAPEIPAEIAAGLAALGGGRVKQGLRYVSQHPVVQGWEGFSGDVASRTAERIEGQWVRGYLQNARRTR